MAIQLPDIAGACACGAVQFHASAPPLARYNCHCRSCQRVGGGAFIPLVVMATVAVRIEGALQWRLAGPDTRTNHARRGCCPSCGMALFARNDRKPELLLIHAGSLEDSDWYEADADIWTLEAFRSLRMDRRIPKVLYSPPLLENDEVARL